MKKVKREEGGIKVFSSSSSTTSSSPFGRRGWEIRSVSKGRQGGGVEGRGEGERKGWC